MFKHRLLNIVSIVALVIVIVLTIQQGLETTKVVHAAEIKGQYIQPMDTSFCPLPLVDRSSLRSVYVKQMGIWVSRTNSGPTGVDGGLIQLLSDYRDCSQ